MDCTFGQKGLPQSATGQTALFTGLAAPRLIGGHVTGFPGEKLSEMILNHSILKQLKEKGLKITSANAYSHEYFKTVEEKKKKVSASTLTIQAAGIPIRMLEDLEKGNAVFMDITHHLLKTRNSGFLEISPRKAGMNLINILNQNDFVLYEYFWTDYCGHRGTLKEKKEIISHLNAFLKTIVKKTDTGKHTIIVASDHGNIECSKSRKHTDNPIPLIVFSKKASVKNLFYHGVKELSDIPNLIIKGFLSRVLK